MDEFTQLILEEIGRLNQFVTEFLYLAKQSSPKPVPSNMNELIENALTLFEEKFREKLIEVRKNIDSHLPSVRVDPHQMEQVFLNLIINAMDAMPEGGRLEVSTAHEEGGQGHLSPTAVVSIQDSGVGIPEENLQNIFDPFFSTKPNGTGLGLPISLGIVESHGGRLRIESRQGGGTKATIELPLDRAAGEP